MAAKRTWSVFTKPWREKTPAELGGLVSGLGFTAIELPLRPGYQVEPENAERDLPAIQRALGEYGVRVASVASGTEERIFAACQAADVRILRIMVGADRSQGYLKSIEKTRRELDALVPLCERYGVTLGVQHHYGFGVFNTMEMRHLLEGYDSKHIGAIWDAAHSALSAELPEQALDIIWDKLCLVNLKAAYYRRTNGPEASQAAFEPYFTTGQNGASSWKEIADYLVRRGYAGDICMPAEYTDEPNVEDYIARDFAYAKSLFGE